jgi:hypothetical protein
MNITKFHDISLQDLKQVVQKTLPPVLDLSDFQNQSLQYFFPKLRERLINQIWRTDTDDMRTFNTKMNVLLHFGIDDYAFELEEERAAKKRETEKAKE